MNLSPNARLFYFSYNYLWNVFASIEVLFEIPEIDGDTWKLIRFDNVHEQIAEWLLQEQFDVVEKENRSSNVLEELYIESRENIAPILRQWSDIILDESNRAHEIISSVGRAAWAYYLYCDWLKKTLNAYNLLMEEHGVQSDILYRRYTSKVAMFDELHRLIRDEEHRFFLRFNEDHILDAIIKEIDKTASQMAMEWREAVLAVSFGSAIE